MKKALIVVAASALCLAMGCDKKERSKEEQFEGLVREACEIRVEAQVKQAKAHFAGLTEEQKDAEIEKGRQEIERLEKQFAK